MVIKNKFLVKVLFNFFKVSANQEVETLEDGGKEAELFLHLGIQAVIMLVLIC